MTVEMAGMLDRKVREGSKNGCVNRQKGKRWQQEWLGCQTERLEKAVKMVVRTDREVKDDSINGWDARQKGKRRQ